MSENFNSWRSQWIWKLNTWEWYGTAGKRAAWETGLQGTVSRLFFYRKKIGSRTPDHLWSNEDIKEAVTSHFELVTASFISVFLNRLYNGVTNVALPDKFGKAERCCSSWNELSNANIMLWKNRLYYLLYGSFCLEHKFSVTKKSWVNMLIILFNISNK